MPRAKGSGQPRESMMEIARRTGAASNTNKTGKEGRMERERTKHSVRDIAQGRKCGRPHRRKAREPLARRENCDFRHAAPAKIRGKKREEDSRRPSMRSVAMSLAGLLCLLPSAVVGFSPSSMRLAPARCCPRCCCPTGMCTAGVLGQEDDPTSCRDGTHMMHVVHRAHVR